ncbi:MAG: N-6 DNA methylase [Kiritimatiellia bacterium]
MAKDSGKVIQEKSNVLWNVANTISGLYKPHEYGLVILPMAVVKRFHDCLTRTQKQVLKAAQTYAKNAMKDAFLRKASGYAFYNTSKFDFETLVADPKNIGANFRDYLSGFSPNVRDVLEMMNFDDQVANLDKNGVLYHVVYDFNAAKAYLGPDEVATNDMGYIFENLVQRFSESYDEQAGAHFTSRDIIYLMCDLLLACYRGDRKNLMKAVYDMTMGTSQMLTCMEDRLKEVHPEMDVANFGQEFNPFTFAIAKADMLIRGGDPENMRYGNTLSDDKFRDFLFDFIISNPPFGIDWKKEARVVEAEAAKGEEGRFAPGLPPKSDGQMLFLLNGVKKLKDDGCMAIIQNGSSLFTGDAGSGPSEIRRYLIENDWLDAIVQLPNDSFYNTGIATYVWIISKAKPRARRGKVQLIDASACCEVRRKPIGNKRHDISDAARALIVKAYLEFRDETYESAGAAPRADRPALVVKSRVFDGRAFGYTKVTVVTKTDKDTENIPLGEDVDAYMAREVLPYSPGAKIDPKKSKVGYEIPFTRTFYEYKKIEPAADIAARIAQHEKALMGDLKELLGESGK